MAEILEKEKYYEGAIFHAYHAFESICYAELGESAEDLDHDRRLRLFIEPYPAGELRSKFFETYHTLGSFTGSKTPVGTRNKSLYYDNYKKEEPYKRFKAEDAETAINLVDEVVELIIEKWDNQNVK